MRIDHRCKLLYGPYKMPQCQLGKKLFCEFRGWIQVKRISDGRIPWPQTIIGGGRTFIICGEQQFLPAQNQPGRPPGQQIFLPSQNQPARPPAPAPVVQAQRSRRSQRRLRPAA